MVQKSNVNDGAQLRLMTETGDCFNEWKPIYSDLLIFGCSQVILQTWSTMINESTEIDFGVKELSQNMTLILFVIREIKAGLNFMMGSKSRAEIKEIQFTIQSIKIMSTL